MSEEDFLRLKELVDNCNKCNFSTCEQCEISWNDVQKIRNLLDLYNKQQRIMKSQEKIIMEQEKEIDKYKKQEFGNLFNGKYISKTEIRDKIKKLEEKEEKNYNLTGLITECEIKIETLKELLEE